MTSLIETAWAEVVEAFEYINTTNSLADGGGNFRTTPVKVFKRFKRLDEVQEYPAIAIYPSDFTDVLGEGTNSLTIRMNFRLRVIGYISGNTDHDTAHEQSDLIAQYQALMHDMVRVANQLSLDHVDDTSVRFIIERDEKRFRLKVSPPIVDTNLSNKAFFFFDLPIQILWGNRGLTEN